MPDKDKDDLEREFVQSSAKRGTFMTRLHSWESEKENNPKGKV